MSDRRDLPRDVNLNETRITNPHPAGPSRSADPRHFSETASTEFSGSARADAAPGVDPYKTEPPKKGKGGVLIRMAIFALILGAGAVLYVQFAGEARAPMTIEQASMTDPRVAPVATTTPEAAPATEPAMTPAP